MASWTDVTNALRGLDGVERVQARMGRQWKLNDGLLAWERPLRKSDLAALGDSAPQGDILGVRVPMEIKEALLERDVPAYFTIPHFDGYAAILVHLPSIKVGELKPFLKSAYAERAKLKPSSKRKRPRRSP